MNSPGGCAPIRRSRKPCVVMSRVTRNHCGNGILLLSAVTLAVVVGCRTSQAVVDDQSQVDPMTERLSERLKREVQRSRMTSIAAVKFMEKTEANKAKPSLKQLVLSQPKLDQLVLSEPKLDRRELSEPKLDRPEFSEPRLARSVSDQPDFQMPLVRHSVSGKWQKSMRVAAVKSVSNEKAVIKPEKKESFPERRLPEKTLPDRPTVERSPPKKLITGVVQKASLTQPVKDDRGVEKKSEDEGSPFPVDLPTVLRLAGAQNWNIELAAERVREAQAAVDAAEAMWMPSLQAGMGYNHHTGNIQATPGNVVDARRSSLFLGGGPNLGMAPLTGGSGGPLRMGVNLSLADVIFKPLAARQRLDVERSRQTATFNDTLQAAALAYFGLVYSQGRLANLRMDLQDARALLRQTEAFVTAGKGSQADVTRMATDVQRRQQRVAVAESDVSIASAHLARQLRLDPSTTLFALEEQAVPVDLLEESTTLEGLVDGALSTRPELAAARASVDVAGSDRSAADWKPWLPHLQMGFSAGGFGGAPSDSIGRLGGRTDFDLLAVWEIQNMGKGTRAARDAATSRERQAAVTLSRTRDDVVTEVTQAWHDAAGNRKRLAMSGERLKQAGESLRLHRLRIRGMIGLPLEALQAVESISQARQDRLQSIIGFNRSQVGLLRAVGRPLGGNR